MTGAYDIICIFDIQQTT